MKSEIKTMIGCVCGMSLCAGVLFLIDKNFNDHLYLIYAGFGFPIAVGIVGLIFLGVTKLKHSQKG